MHKVYENDDFMMYFKKRYCRFCGKVLSKKRTEKVVRKGEPEHKSYCSVGTTYKLYGDILVVGKEYYCPLCNKSFSCDEQGKINKAQKYYKRYIVNEEEITNIKQKNMVADYEKILKMRWLLLIPLIGSLICNFFVFNGYLNEKTKHKDLYKLTLVSILFLIVVSLIIKSVIQLTNISITENYKTLLMLIPSLLSFNIPTLCYINRKFTK